MRGESQAPFETNVCQKGKAPLEAIDSKAKPSKPDTGLVNRPEETWSHTPNIWLLTENPAIWTTSDPSEPTAWPEPYVMPNFVLSFLKLEEPDVSNVGADPQPVLHKDPATQRSLDLKKKFNMRIRRDFGAYADPVSRITLKDVGGVPIANEPK